MKISQLKSQLVELEEADKAYKELLHKYQQLQKEYQMMNDAKLHLEYELKQKTENSCKILNDLKIQNCDLTNELNEKNSIYEKLFSDNANLLRNLNKRKLENENFCKTFRENENIINILNEENNKCEKDAYELDNIAKKNECDINDLCNQLNSLKLKSQNQSDELTRKNIEFNNNTRTLKDLKSTNESLNNKLNSRNVSLDALQNLLNEANKSILDLQNELNNLEQSNNISKDQLQKMRIDYQNEHNKRLLAEEDNVKLESMLKDRNEKVSKLTYINDQLKSDKEKLDKGKNDLMAEIEKYKNHIMVLTDQTNQLTSELERIIAEDTELYDLNSKQIQRLEKVIYENKKLLQDEIEALNALEDYVKCQPVIQEAEKVELRNTKTYSRKVQ